MFNNKKHIVIIGAVFAVFLLPNPLQLFSQTNKNTT